ncbi:receptor L domain protein [Ancylostoma caninum]|uniref:Receptor L domain protein n=1 Tax=Ancylostoma caninum TaxID=29170 RepID=A0A368H8G2_ANCCA|nr:receptor L domain protein [Ancylostoma caninum]
MIGLSFSIAAPALSIKDNKRLVDVCELATMKIKGRMPLLEISGNDKICAPASVRRKARKLAMKDVQFDGSCLKSCQGGVVDKRFLEEFQKERECRVIVGDLIIKGLNANNTKLEKLRRIERIEKGSLVFQQNIGYESMLFLSNLEVISHPSSHEPALQIANNYGMKFIGLPSLKTVEAADEDRAIEIYTYEEMPKSEKRRLMDVANKREIFTLGRKNIDETHRVHEEYNNNALLGFLLTVFLGMVLMGAAAILLLTICRRERRRRHSEEGIPLRARSAPRHYRESLDSYPSASFEESNEFEQRSKATSVGKPKTTSYSRESAVD